MTSLFLSSDTVMIQITCHACRATLQAPDESAGQKHPCIKCGELLLIPSPSVLTEITPPDPLVRCHKCGIVRPASSMARRNVKTGDSSATWYSGGQAGLGHISHHGMVDLCPSCVDGHDWQQGALIAGVLGVIVVLGVALVIKVLMLAIFG